MKVWASVYLPPAPKGITHSPLKLRDSYSRDLSELSDNSISSYVCGITPYDATHLGHAATYLTFDLIHRYVLASGRTLNFTENITDIDDPLLERASRDNQDWRDLALSQINLFRDDMTSLRVIPPNSYLGVVETMPIIIKMIEDLVATHLCYEIDGDYYLSIKEVPGAIENLPLEMEDALSVFAERGGDPTRPGKRHPLDTLIWLRNRPGEPSWESSFGSGRPGWHIECVAIALSTLGSGAKSFISIQGGGSDLRFPHHYMTSVQVRALTAKPFASIYSHAGMIEWKGEKMSKSRGNLVFVSKLLVEGWSGEEIRLALIDRNYESDFGWESTHLLRAREKLSRWRSNLSRESAAPALPFIQDLADCLANNLNTEGAIAAVDRWCFATESGSEEASPGEMARALDTYLGISL
jgi:L-cysteine:1D-myo-inositol 2-amino-2-deoxy-alpha-D-glucopyranoside ligase